MDSQRQLSPDSYAYFTTIAIPRSHANLPASIPTPPWADSASGGSSRANPIPQHLQMYSPVTDNSGSYNPSPVTPHSNCDSAHPSPNLDLDPLDAPCINSEATPYGNDSLLFPSMENDSEAGPHLPPQNRSSFGYMPTQESNIRPTSKKHISLSQVTNNASTSVLEIPPRPSFVSHSQYLSPYTNNSATLSPLTPWIEPADISPITTFYDSDAPSPSTSFIDNDYKHRPSSNMRSEMYSPSVAASSPLFESDSRLTPSTHPVLLAPMSYIDSREPRRSSYEEEEHLGQVDSNVGPTRGALIRKKERQRQNINTIFPVIRSTITEKGMVNKKSKHSKPRADFTWEKKWEMWDMHKANPMMNQEDLAKEFGVERSTISVALKKIRKALEEGGAVGDEPGKTTRYTKLDSDLVEFLQNCRTEDINDALITEKALEFSQRDDELRDKFKASRSWRDRFKDRHEIECPPHNPVIFHSSPHLADSDIGIKVEAASDDSQAQTHSSPSHYQSAISLPQLPNILVQDPDRSQSDNPTAEEADAAMDTVLRFVRAQMVGCVSEKILEGAEILYRRFGSEFNG